MDTQVHGRINLPSPNRDLGKCFFRILRHSDSVGDKLPRDTGGWFLIDPRLEAYFDHE